MTVGQAVDGSQEGRESGGISGERRVEHGGAGQNDGEGGVEAGGGVGPSGVGAEGGRHRGRGEEGSTEGLGSRARSSTVGAWRRVRAFDENQPLGIDLVDGGECGKKDRVEHQCQLFNLSLNLNLNLIFIPIEN